MLCAWILTSFLLFTLVTPVFAEQQDSGKADLQERPKATHPESVHESSESDTRNEQAKHPDDAASALSLRSQRGQEELEALKSRPKEFRVLVLGVQIFLGRFGYGTGPYTGKLDGRTQDALKAYQAHVGLPQSGEIDYQTLTSLTEDNRLLDRPLPYLPPATFHGTQWERAIHVQGTWARNGEPGDDAVQTSKITCFHEQKQCIESTAVLLNTTAPVLDVQTHVYAIKEWDDEQLVSEPYEGEPCAVTILRINRKLQATTRFTAYQQEAGRCAKVKTQDIQYRLVNGQDVFTILRQKKAEATQKILRVQDE